MAFEVFSWVCASHDRFSYPVSVVYNHQKSNPLHLRNSRHYSSLKNKKVLKTREPAKLQDASTIYYQNRNDGAKINVVNHALILILNSFDAFPIIRTLQFFKCF